LGKGFCILASDVVDFSALVRKVFMYVNFKNEDGTFNERMSINFPVKDYQNWTKDEKQNRSFHLRLFRRACMILQRSLWTSTSYWLFNNLPGKLEKDRRKHIFNSDRLGVASGENL
jgi:hypothetical protein